jgi:hypothetical protein
MFLAKFGSGHVCEDLLLCGWSRPEQDWVWSEGRFSALSVETVSCARCRLLLSIETPLTLGTDAVFRISVNGVDYGERRLAPDVESRRARHLVLSRNRPRAGRERGRRPALDQHRSEVARH